MTKAKAKGKRKGGNFIQNKVKFVGVVLTVLTPISLSKLTVENSVIIAE